MAASILRDRWFFGYITFLAVLAMLIMSQSYFSAEQRSFIGEKIDNVVTNQKIIIQNQKLILSSVNLTGLQNFTDIDEKGKVSGILKGPVVVNITNLP